MSGRVGKLTDRAVQDMAAEALARSPANVVGLAALRGVAAGSKQRAALDDGGRAGSFVWRPGDRSADVTADPGAGVWVAPAADLTGESGAWQRELTGARYHASWYDSLADAFAQVPAGATLDLDAGDYEVAAPLTRSAALVIDGHGATLRQAANATVLGLAGGYTDASACTLAATTVSIGGTTNTVTRLTLAAVPDGWAAGDVVRVVSDDLTAGGATGEQRGECAVIVSTTATEVYLSRVLEDEYTTSPRVARLTPTPYVVRGVRFVSNNPASYTASMVQVTAALGPRLLDLEFDNLGGLGVNLIGCYQAVVDRPTFRRLPNASGRLGYGVNDVSGTQNAVVGLTVDQCRHAQTTNMNGTTAGDSRIERYGPTRDAQVLGARIGYAEASGLDSHAGSRRTRFVDCVVGDVVNGYAASPCAVQLRGIDEQVVNLIAHGCVQALRVSASAVRPIVRGLDSFGSSQPLDIKAATGDVLIESATMDATASSACLIDGARVILRGVSIRHAFAGDYRKTLDVLNGGEVIARDLLIDGRDGSGSNFRPINLESGAASFRGTVRLLRGTNGATAVVRTASASASAVFLARTDATTTPTSGSFALVKHATHSEAAGTSATNVADLSDLLAGVLPALIAA